MKQNITEVYYTPIQLKMPLDIERIIETTDPVYTFNEVMEHIDLNQYFVESLQIKSQAPKRTWRKKILYAAGKQKGQHKKATAGRWLEECMEVGVSRFLAGR